MAVEAAILALILLFQPFELEGKTQKSKVLILGAGAAGIGFANRLDEKGEKDFVILEAQSFIGGRMKDVKFGNLTIQEGANWIHGIGKGNAMYTLKQKYGLRAVRDDYNDLIIRYVNRLDMVHSCEVFHEIGCLERRSSALPFLVPKIAKLIAFAFNAKWKTVGELFNVCG